MVAPFFLPVARWQDLRAKDYPPFVCGVLETDQK